MSNIIDFVKPGCFYFGRTTWGTWYWFEVDAADDTSITICKAMYVAPDFPFADLNITDFSVLPPNVLPKLKRWPEDMMIMWPVSTIGWLHEIKKLP